MVMAVSVRGSVSPWQRQSMAAFACSHTGKRPAVICLHFHS
jgi:hypothetical protein